MKNLFLFLVLCFGEFLYGQSLHKYSIGDSAFCGIVFLVEDIDSLGRQHGLVCAPADQNSGIPWFNGFYITTGASNDQLFDKRNAIIVIKKQGDSANYAALIAANYFPDSICSQWYLPSRTELSYMYKNVANSENPVIKKMGKFKNEGYWSSVESLSDSLSGFSQNISTAYIVDFYDGRQFPVDKANKYRVRAVREFTNY